MMPKLVRPARLRIDKRTRRIDRFNGGAPLERNFEQRQLVINHRARLHCNRQRREEAKVQKSGRDLLQIRRVAEKGKDLVQWATNDLHAMQMISFRHCIRAKHEGTKIAACSVSEGVITIFDVLANATGYKGNRPLRRLTLRLAVDDLLQRRANLGVLKTKARALGHGGQDALAGKKNLGKLAEDHA